MKDHCIGELKEAITSSKSKDRQASLFHLMLVNAEKQKVHEKGMEDVDIALKDIRKGKQENVTPSNFFTIYTVLTQRSLRSLIGCCFSSCLYSCTGHRPSRLEIREFITIK